MLDNVDILESKADSIAENISEWETRSIADIAQRVGRIGKMSREEAKKLNTEEEAKKEWDRIIAALALATVHNIRSLKAAYTDVFDNWHSSNESLYEYKGIKYTEVADNSQIQTLIDRHSKQNARDMTSYTQTKALTVLDRNGNIIRFKDAIHKAFDEATQNVLQGKTDFYTAMSRTIQSLGGSGVRVDYGGGITRRLDTVARQNLLWNLKQAHREYDEEIGKELGCDGTEIDYHTNSRPSHRYMQGRQYSKGEGKTVNGVYYPSAEKEGVYARLYEDYNCHHNETSIILGISVPRYSEEELRRFEEQDKRIYKIGDIEKDGYGWSQVMRRLETETRKAKDEINALSALGGNKEKISQLRQRIKTYQTKYAEISDVTGIAQDPKRMSVPRTAQKVTDDIERGISSKRIHTTEENKVNLEYISSKEYKEKFSKLPYNENVRNSVYEQSKAILMHRNGTYYEDICLVDINTGAIKAVSYNNKIPNEVYYSPKALKAVSENKNTLISIHNHGTNNPPTGSDIVSAGGKQYNMGVVVCHDGSVYTYKPGQKPFSRYYFDNTVDKYRKMAYNEKESILKTLADLSEKYGIIWEEL